MATFAFTWVFVVVGLAAGSVPAAHGLALLVFPLAFVSSAFVPVQSMPAWIEPIAEHQPLTQLVDATRALVLGPAADEALGLGTTGLVASSLLWSLTMTVVFAPLAATLYHRG